MAALCGGDVYSCFRSFKEAGRRRRAAAAAAQAEGGAESDAAAE